MAFAGASGMTAIRRAMIGAAALAALTMAGCTTRKPAPVEPATPTRPAPVAAALSPQAYMTIVASSALLSLRSAEFAQQRVRNPALRAFAANSAVEQRGIGAQLSFAGRRINLLPWAALTPAHQAQYDELAASADVDATYRRQQLAVLAEAHAVHHSFAQRGTSATLRPVARMAGPVLQRALEALRRL
jgi:putative membrane protein